MARIVAAAEVPGAKKLLQLTLSLGGEHRRNVFAGIKSTIGRSNWWADW